MVHRSPHAAVRGRSVLLSLSLLGGLLVLLGQAPAPADRAQPRGDVPPGVDVVRDEVYARPDGRELRLDVFMPSERKSTPEARYPAVVWIHGGGWRQGSKERCPGVSLVRGGFVVVSINYRLSNVATFPAQIHDCKTAVRYLRANAQRFAIDPERIGVWGASAGGHLAALMGTSAEVEFLEGDLGYREQSSRVQAVLDWFGPSDLQQMPVPESRGDDHPVTLLLGGRPRDRMELARLASPVAHVSRDDPPFLIMHGTDDRLVPVSQSRVLHDALVAAGVDSTLHIIPGAGHGGPQFSKAAPVIQEFFVRTLKPR